MQQTDQKTRLLEALDRVAKQTRSVDAQLLRELEKCPSAKAACALLVSALNVSLSSIDRGKMLTAYPGWIHPFV